MLQYRASLSINTLLPDKNRFIINNIFPPPRYFIANHSIQEIVQRSRTDLVIFNENLENFPFETRLILKQKKKKNSQGSKLSERRSNHEGKLSRPRCSLRFYCPWRSARSKGMQGYRRHVQDTRSGDRRLGWRRNGERAASSVVRSVRRKCRAGSSSRQPVSREKEASRGDSRASRTNLTALVGVAVFTCQLVESYLTAVCRCATCAMGMMGMFKWLRK